MEADLPAYRTKLSSRKWLILLIAVSCLFVTGLALTRLIFEWRFPAALEFGRPLPVLFVALSLAFLSAIVARQYVPRFVTVIALIPLLFNLTWILDPVVDPARNLFLFGASLWLVTVLVVNQVVKEGNYHVWRRAGSILIGMALLPVYLLSMSHAVGDADTFEFQVVAPQLGIAHPTGYPLYLLLGKLFSLLPWGTVAWRVNLASVVFAISATIVLYLLAFRLFRRPLPAMVGAIALGLAPIFWSQAIIAEVYALHALILAVALRLMIRVLDEQRRRLGDRQSAIFDNRKTLIALAFVLGLGLTNHLTTLFLLPAAGVTFVFFAVQTMRTYQRSAISGPRSILWLVCLMAVAFMVPLLLYAYLPIRWQAINGEPMGWSRFFDWVAGGRFQGALQWAAWLRDPARFTIIGRLVFNEWSWFYLSLAALGLLYLFKRFWPAALILLLTAAGFTFYALNYYVPDLAVFLIPTHVVVAIWVSGGVAAIYALVERGMRRFSKGEVNQDASAVLLTLIFVLATVPAFWRAAGLWTTIDQSARNGGETWARGVLSMPLQRGAVILADSEKIAPLYYMQQTERLRTDIDIMVLPDEAAYRTELDNRIAAGQAVYLARFLPELQSAYHLRSAGPLVEVSPQPVSEPPGDMVAVDQSFGPVRLLGYDVQPESVIDPASTSLTLYWTLDQPLDPGIELPTLYLRWLGMGRSDVAIAGQHAVHNYYPVNAWRPGEIVVDTHYLPMPDVDCEIGTDLCPMEIQIALAPRFTPAAELSWETLTSVNLAPRSGPVGLPQRAYFETFALDGVDLIGQGRPDDRLWLRYSGFGAGKGMSMLLIPEDAVNSFIFPTGDAPQADIVAEESVVYSQALEAPAQTGPHVVIALPEGELRAICHWLAWPTTGCIVGQSDIRGAPLTEGAVNFDDRLALLDVELPRPVIEPGGRLPVDITWQGLSSMNENYTVFVQVLDEQDRIVGQVDAWPVQGTLPTSQWQPGQVVRDPYVIQLNEDIQPGNYRLHIGLYLLGTLERLPVVDDTGQAIDDKVEIWLGGK